MPVISYREAMSKAMREALHEDEDLFLMGEDIGAYGGPYAVTKGFLAEFGPRRVVDSPLAESAIIGACTGAAMAGLHPVAEIMTINFTLLAMDQIVNHAAKMRYMSAGQFTAPMIIRTVTGGGAQLGATHSQSLEGWYASVPGLKVVVPATPYDALGLFRAVRQEEDPVLFVEHILLYSSRGDVPDERYVVPVGKADVKRRGDGFTIVAYARMVAVALDIGDLALLHMHVDAAATGAHVAGGLANLVRDLGRQIKRRLGVRHGRAGSFSRARVWRAICFSSAAGMTQEGIFPAQRRFARTFSLTPESFSPMPPVKAMPSIPPMAAIIDPACRVIQ